jgi:hypothetical protein
MKLLIAAVLAVFPALAQEPYLATGPLAMVITYRCSPDQRANLRRLMLESGVARFEAWKANGILKEYHILFNRYLDTETYDMLSLLEFSKYSDVVRWQDIEKDNPGGLGDDALELITSAVTTPVDLARRNAAEILPERGHSVYFIIPYDEQLPAAEYMKYLDGYILPQTNGWIAENVLASYSIGVGRYATSRPWSSIFFLEYRDPESFGRREATVAKVRAALQEDAVWKSFSEAKQKVRVEKQSIIAEELLPAK